MNLNNVVKLSGFVLAALLIASCAPKAKSSEGSSAISKPPRNSTVSTATGWTYENENFTGRNGYASSGFAAHENYRPQIPAGMVVIEGGTFMMGEKTDLITAQRDNLTRRVSVGSFYMDQHEVSNLDWREYVHWMEVVYGATAPRLVDKARPNVDKLSDPMTYNEPYLDRYYSHPAFNHYPVVGITWEQAMDYCQWRTDRMNELVLVRAGVLAEPDFSYVQRENNLDSIAQNFVFNTDKYLLQRSYNPKPGPKPLKNAFGGVRKSDMGDGLMYPNFRLPTEAEWEFAAYGLKAEKNGLIAEGRIYPWSGDQMRTTKTGKQQGRMQANYVRGRGDMMGTAGDLNDKYTTTAPVNEYAPNDFGLYNMAGNVNEWVMDVYRSTSSQDVAEYNPFRGNEERSYLADFKDENGNYNLKIDSLGRVAYVVLPKEDLRGFKDGSGQLSTDFKLYTDPEGETALRNNRQLDPTDVLAPKITNKTRVYKGGSWKDRAYWLNPSTRRYLNQDKSANDIGFRCAMTMLGSIDDQPVKKKTSTKKK